MSRYLIIHFYNQYLYKYVYFKFDATDQCYFLYFHVRTILRCFLVKRFFFLSMQLVPTIGFILIK